MGGSTGRRWGVGDVLCVQGLGYLVVTCAANVPVAVLAFLDLNSAFHPEPIYFVGRVIDGSSLIALCNLIVSALAV